jgi:hypothetical protein
MSEGELTANWQGDRPIVTVRCSTYQHVDFIEQALHGFLSQRTDFPYEVLVIDDASTDGTAEIVEDYARRYPNVVRAALHTVNHRTLRLRGERVVREPALGAFIAPCEGDDYWLDPTKLDTQVRLLRARPDAAVSHHDALVIRNGVVTSLSMIPDRQRDLTAQELRHGSPLPLRSICYRNDPRLDEGTERYRPHIWSGDRFLTARLGLLGGSVYAGTLLPAVYRRHAGGISHQLRVDPVQRAATKTTSAMWSAAYFLERGEFETAYMFLRRAVLSVPLTDPEHGFDPRLRLAAALARRALPDAVSALLRRLLRHRPR